MSYRWVEDQLRSHCTILDDANNKLARLYFKSKQRKSSYWVHWQKGSLAHAVDIILLAEDMTKQEMQDFVLSQYVLML